MNVKPSIDNELLQMSALVVVSVLLILTSIGNAWVLFWASLGTMLGLFIWFLTDRKFWLATISGLTFAIVVLGFVSRLF